MASPAASADKPSSAAAALPAGFRADLGSTLDSIVAASIADGVAPGASLFVSRHGSTVHAASYGHLATHAPAASSDVNSTKVSGSTLWDVASLTKVVATTTALMLLEEQGKLSLDASVASYLPGLTDPSKATITVRQLLTHSAGFEAFSDLHKTCAGREEYLAAINTRPLLCEPGSRMVYSDWDFILLQMVVESVTKQPLDIFTREQLWVPLGMTDTCFNPAPELKPRIAPTEIQEARGGMVHGSVHDENAHALGGVAGHAGLFSTAEDLGKFGAMMLGGGSTSTGQHILRPSTIARWTARQGLLSSRALGWDTPSSNSSAGRFLSPRSFGHTGFTGTSLWADPQSGILIVLLSNRVHPTRDNQKIFALRRDVADAVCEAIRDQPLIDWEAREEAK